MAMTDRERKQAQKAREEAERRASPDSTYPLLKEPFSEYLRHEGNYVNVEIAFALMGLEAPIFDDERGPADVADEHAIAGVENPFPGAERAIGRAEVMVDCLIDAATELSQIVSRYKRRELKARLQELEDDEKLDRAEAMEQAVKINKILDQLDKQVRRSFPQWKVTGA